MQVMRSHADIYVVGISNGGDDQEREFDCEKTI